MREFFTIAIFKIKADIRMNKTTLNSQKEKHSMPSLRRATRPGQRLQSVTGFLSTLSLRRATLDYFDFSRFRYDFYPRSPCGERPFLIISLPSCGNFYPRSPCGERRPLKAGQTYYCEFLSTLSLRRATVTVLGIQHRVGISIHALLAESDLWVWMGGLSCDISIHALLAESDP